MVATVQRCDIATEDPVAGLAALGRVFPGLRTHHPVGRPFGLALSSTILGPVASHHVHWRSPPVTGTADLTGVVAIGHVMAGTPALGVDTEWIRPQGPFLHPPGEHPAAWAELETGVVTLERAVVEEYAQHLADTDRFRLVFTGHTPVNKTAAARWVHTMGHLRTTVLAHTEAMEVPLIRSEAVRTLITTVLACFPNTLQDHVQPGPQAGTLGRALRRATAFIDENLDTDISLAQITAAARLSPHGTLAAFRRHTGLTPQEYVRSTRLDAARHDLLQHTPEHPGGVTAIAAHWGFADPVGFRHQYRTTYQEPPPPPPCSAAEPARTSPAETGRGAVPPPPQTSTGAAATAHGQPAPSPIVSMQIPLALLMVGSRI